MKKMKGTKGSQVKGMKKMKWEWENKRNKGQCKGMKKVKWNEKNEVKTKKNEVGMKKSKRNEGEIKNNTKKWRRDEK